MGSPSIWALCPITQTNFSEFAGISPKYFDKLFRPLVNIFPWTNLMKAVTNQPLGGARERQNVPSCREQSLPNLVRLE